MNLEIWITFVLTATVILAIPGPTIIYVVGQSLTHGNKDALPLATGVVLGDAVLICKPADGIQSPLYRLCHHQTRHSPTDIYPPCCARSINA